VFGALLFSFKFFVTELAQKAFIRKRN